MVNGVENDSFRIGKMKCGLASYADLALGTANLEHPEGGQITRLRPLRRPSQPKQHRDFHQAETELTTPRPGDIAEKKVV